MMGHDDGTFLPCHENKKNDRKEQFTKIDDHNKHCNYNKKVHEQQKNNNGEWTCEHVHLKKSDDQVDGTSFCLAHYSNQNNEDK